MAYFCKFNVGYFSSHFAVKPYVIFSVKKEPEGRISRHSSVILLIQTDRFNISHRSLQFQSWQKCFPPAYPYRTDLLLRG